MDIMANEFGLEADLQTSGIVAVAALLSYTLYKHFSMKPSAVSSEWVAPVTEADFNKLGNAFSSTGKALLEWLNMNETMSGAKQLGEQAADKIVKTLELVNIKASSQEFLTASKEKLEWLAQAFLSVGETFWNHFKKTNVAANVAADADHQESSVERQDSLSSHQSASEDLSEASDKDVAYPVDHDHPADARMSNAMISQYHEQSKVLRNTPLVDIYSEQADNHQDRDYEEDRRPAISAELV